MKKLFLTLMLAVMGFTAAMADDATTLVATLNHGGTMKAFYGADAFKSAYDEATDGDIITLSAGRFNMDQYVRKNITVRGLGGWPDANNAMTVLINPNQKYVSIYIQENDNELTFEGVRFLPSVNIDVESGMTEGTCTFSKVNFFYAQSYDNYHSINGYQKVYLKLNNCLVENGATIYQGACNNCVFNNRYNSTSVSSDNCNSPITFQNCVIRDWTGITEDVLTNCLVINKNSGTFDYTNLVTNCVGFYSGTIEDVDFFSNSGNSTNKMVTELNDCATFFKNESLLTPTTQNGAVTYYSVKNDDLNADGTGLYELSDAAKQIYKGNDGTVVGVWGGAYPFNLKTTNPRLTKCEIIPRVDSSGKLSVTIEVAQ